MYCLQCGHGVPARARFCRLCGTALDQDLVSLSHYRARYQALTLWNPTVAILWSWLFSPVFGSYIHMRNWLALDEPEQAAYAKIWLYLSIGVQLALLGSVFVADRLSAAHLSFFSLIYFALWYFSFAKQQRRYLDRNALSDYTKKSWAKILTLSVIADILYMCFAAMIVASVSASSQSSAQSAQASTDDARYGSFAQFVPKQNAAASAPQSASVDANEAAAIPTQPTQQTSVSSQDSQPGGELQDYANQEFAFALRYPASWISATPQSPNSRARFMSRAGTAVAECAVIVIRRPDIDNADQASINAVFRELPSAAELKGSLAQLFQAPEVINAKIGALGPLPAYDARVTYSAVSGTSTVFASGRVVTTASPGYIWTLSCGGVGLTPAAAEQAYSHWENEINQFITSFKFL